MRRLARVLLLLIIMTVCASFSKVWRCCRGRTRAGSRKDGGVVLLLLSLDFWNVPELKVKKWGMRTAVLVWRYQRAMRTRILLRSAKGDDVTRAVFTTAFYINDSDYKKKCEKPNKHQCYFVVTKHFSERQKL